MSELSKASIETLKEVSALLGGEFVQKHEHNGSIVFADGSSIFAYNKWNSKEGTIILSPMYPTAKEGYSLHKSNVSITCSLTKKVSLIVSDIKRRLLTEYTPKFQENATWIAERNEVHDNKIENTKKVSAILGNEFRGSYVDSKQTAFINDMYVTCSTRNSGTEVVISSLSVDQLTKVTELLKSFAK